MRDILAAISHRGPDDRGLVAGANFTLGHARLSIVDRTRRGRQPMWDRDGALCITFNGEIYNHGELRRELIGAGVRFATGTDTEVLLELYKRDGPAFLDRLDGVFAFCLHDTRRDAFVLARDRAGVKPLYWGQAPQGFAFGSEPKCVFMWPGFRRNLNLAAASQWLAYRNAFDDTLFEGVKVLPPAHVMEISGGRRVMRRYWAIDPLRSRRRGVGEAAAAFKDAFAGAVTRQAHAEVPVGLFLSGGLDSTAMLDAFSASSTRPPEVFTASVAVRGYDELRYARLAAASYGARLHETRVTAEDYLDQIDALTAVKDLPLAMHNEIAVFQMAKAARQHVTVALSGEGADEILAGYGRLARTPFDAEQSRDTRRGDPLSGFLRHYNYFPFELQRRLFRPELLAGVDEAQQRSADLIGARWAEAAPRSGLTAVSHVLTGLHLPSLLQMMDSATMASGLELRAPFTDHRLTELAFELADEHKLAWRFPGARRLAGLLPSALYSERLDRTKVVLRDAYGATAPRAILRRRKMGFPLPLGLWAAGPWRQDIEHRLRSSDGPLWSILDRTATGRWLEESLARPTVDGFGKMVWALLSLDRWWRLRL